MLNSLIASSFFQEMNNYITCIQFYQKKAISAIIFVSQKKNPPSFFFQIMLKIIKL